MIYKFRSKAAGDIIMMAPTGDRVLGVIGKAAGPKGIIEPADMPAAIEALSAAIAADDAQRQAKPAEDDADEPATRTDAEPISLRQRAWPLVEMMKRAAAADQPIVWGA